MSRRYGLTRNRSDFEPTVDEVIRTADEQIGVIEPKIYSIREWYEATADERQAKWNAHRDEPIDVGAVTLEVGKWYDVAVAGQTYFGGQAQQVKTWRNCRYLGKAGDLPILYFERWGAKAATDRYATGSNDSSRLAKTDSVHSYERLGIVAVTALIPDPRLVEKAGPFRADGE